MKLISMDPVYSKIAAVLAGFSEGNLPEVYAYLLSLTFVGQKRR